MFGWFRRIVRRKTGPIPRDVAQDWKIKLSKLYMFLGFNLIGLVIIATARDRLELGDGTGPSRHLYLGAGKNIHLVKVQGLSITSRREFDGEGNEIFHDNIVDNQSSSDDLK